ncbi:unnamed protein product, partial [Ixodes pacificus]
IYYTNLLSFPDTSMYPLERNTMACGYPNSDLFVKCNTTGNFFFFWDRSVRLIKPYLYQVCAFPFAIPHLPGYTVHNPPHVACETAAPDTVQVGGTLVVDCPDGTAKYVCGQDRLYHLVVDDNGGFLEDVDSNYAPHSLEVDKVCREPARYYSYVDYNEDDLLSSSHNNRTKEKKNNLEKKDGDDDGGLSVWIVAVATGGGILLTAGLLVLFLVYGKTCSCKRRNNTSAVVTAKEEEQIYENVPGEAVRRLDSMLKCRDFLTSTKRTDL